jgi:arginyl-tRNA synthetase
MKTIHSKLKNDLSILLEQTLKESFDQINTDSDQIAKSLTAPPQQDLGDFSFPCFPFAKELKKSPAQIAKTLEEKIVLPDYLSKVSAMGPYVNITFKTTWLRDEILENIKNQSFFKQELFSQTPKLVIEYSQPNTHKELHVGHMRNLCLGNALIRMLRFSNHDVVSCTFPGDVGTHVAKCLWYLKNHNQENIPEENKGAWLGKMYSLAHNKLETELGTPQEEKNRTELTEILKQIEKNKGEFFELWQETRQWSIELFKKVYDWAQVSFDRWYWESEVDSSSLKFAQELFEKGLLTKDQGAIGMDLSDQKLGFCLLIKSDGNGLYATKDLDLARKKFDEYDADQSIYIVDKRQAHHFKQVFAVLEKIGHPKAKNCFHLQYDFVELPDGAMSSRKGNIVPLQDLIEQMEDTIKKQHLEKYQQDWSEEKLEKTAYIIAEGAIKYGMLRMDSQKKIVFQMDEWLKTDGESGPYLQYVYARIQSLLNKFPMENKKLEYEFSHPLEHQLLVKIFKFHETVQLAVTLRKTSTLCGYLYECAKLFNSFYAECPIGKADSEAEKEGRLVLAFATGQTLKTGLDLLGISVPDQM